jgi:dTDP-4-amino-4,6-dideoxygalactose transaminase
MKVPFGDLARQYQSMREEVDAAVARVLHRGWFILGEELIAFENEFAAYLGCKHVIGVGSGTEALHLGLVAAGVLPGDEVITAANTCVPTAAAISSAGARVVLVDIDPASLNMRPAELKRALGAKTKAIVPVHLYGRPADMDPILDIARQAGLLVVEDAAQAHGTRYKGRKLGVLADAGCFSFYPSKNLGAFGDAGAVATDNDDIADKVRKLRNYGEERRYYHETKGFNSRLDEVQAAILRAKLRRLDAWNSRRQEIADHYDREIVNPLVTKPPRLPYGEPNNHLYVVRCSHRSDLQAHLASEGVGTLIHYPIPLHMQGAYAELGEGPGSYPVAELVASEILSLPIFPELTDAEIRHVIDSINSFSPR